MFGGITQLQSTIRGRLFYHHPAMPLPKYVSDGRRVHPSRQSADGTPGGLPPPPPQRPPPALPPADVHTSLPSEAAAPSGSVVVGNVAINRMNPNPTGGPHDETTEEFGLQSAEAYWDFDEQRWVYDEVELEEDDDDGG